EKVDQDRVDEIGPLHLRQVAGSRNRVEAGLRNGAPHSGGMLEWNGPVLGAPQDQDRNPGSADGGVKRIRRHPTEFDGRRAERPAETAVSHLDPISIDPIGPPGWLDEIGELSLRHARYDESLPERGP